MTDLAAVGTVAQVAGAYVALHAAHRFADHWVQTSHQACVKDQPGWPGRYACAKHVATYTATAVAALFALIAVTGISFSPARVAIGLGISAATHYFADRRTPLRRVAKLIGADGYFQLNAKKRENGTFEYGIGTGAYELDQAWHIAWLFVAALIIGG